MGMYREFALRAMSMVRRRGRPPVFSAQAFWPYAAERTLAQAVREALLESWRRELAGAVEDSDEGDGGFESSVREAAERAAEAISANAGESLAKFSEMTIGIPYLPAGTERAVLGEWTETFVKLCRSADAQGKADIARAVSGGKMRGENMRQVESAVEASLKGKAKSKAELIARTETGKLNNACTMAGYREAGITRYRWLATPDERTRPSHAAMNGRICAVGEPDTWYEDTERGLERRARTQDMYHGDPGTDFQCRCTCVPWDAAVDSKYGVREVPEPEPKEPSPLEREREENERLRGLIERERTKKFRFEVNGIANTDRPEGKTNAFLRKLMLETAEQKASVSADLNKFKKLRNPECIDEAAKKANPKYDPMDSGFGFNCQRAIIAYLLRRKGFDVVARPCPEFDIFNEGGINGKRDGWTLAFTSCKCEKLKLNKNGRPNVGDYINALTRKIRTSEKNSTFVLRYKTRIVGNFGGGGHVIIVENDGKNPIFIDPQEGLRIHLNFESIIMDSIALANVTNVEFSENVFSLVE